MSRAKTYAAALTESLKDGKDGKAKIARFLQIVKKRGDMRLLSSIVKEAEELGELEKGRKARLVTARKLSDTERQKAVERLRGLNWAVTEEVRPEVIGGAALFLENSVLIDGTVRKRLQRIFQ